MPAKVVQEILWHSRISIIWIYAHALPGMHEEAMKKMDDWFGNSDDQKNTPAGKGGKVNFAQVLTVMQYGSLLTVEEFTPDTERRSVICHASGSRS